jgi:hypothetical protein
MREFYKPILIERNIEPLIKFFIKKWDKERESGEIPKFDLKEVRKLGLFEHQKELRNALIDYYVDHYRGKWVLLLEDSIKSKTYSTTDIEKSGTDVGGYDFEFKITKFNIVDYTIMDPRQVPSMTVNIEFVITKGDVELFFYDGLTKSLTDPVNQNFNYWWEILIEIKDVIKPFIEQLVLEFGFKLILPSLINKTYENKVIKESREDKKGLIAKKFLDSLQLDVWHSKEYGMEYLATKKGTVIILVDNYSASIQQEIYDTLLNIFSNDEDIFEKFIENYIISKGITITDNFKYVDSSGDVGKLEYDEDHKGPRSNNIQEAKGKMLPKNKFVKEYLSKFNNLKKYRSADKYYIYLANDSGKILVQHNTAINETGVDDRIWNTLKIYFNETEVRRKIISWLLNEYNISDMGYVYKSSPSVLDDIGPGDTLVEKDQITESEDKNKLKDFFFKKWSKQKEKGENPNLNAKEISSLGLSKFKNDIILYYTEFMGLDPNNTNRRTEVIKNYLLNNTFDEKNVSMITEWLDQGKIEFKINSVEFFEDELGRIDVDVSFTVLNGSFYNQDGGFTTNFSTGNIPFDDMVEHWEFTNMINEIIENFIGQTLENFGFELNKDFNSIEVGW